MKANDLLVIIEQLAERFPQAFVVFEQRRKPLKIGIYDDIAAAINGAIAPRELDYALHFYCHNEGYLRSMRAGAARVDLMGHPGDEVTAEQAAAQPRNSRSSPSGASAGASPDSRRLHRRRALSLRDLRQLAKDRKQRRA